MHEMSSVPEVFKTPEYERLFILAEIGNFTAEEYKQYEQSIRNMSDYYNTIDTAAEEAEKRGLAKGLAKGREEGREEGIEIGLQKGIEKGKLETAKELKALGVDVDIIVKNTGLSIDQINALEQIKGTKSMGNRSFNVSVFFDSATPVVGNPSR